MAFDTVRILADFQPILRWNSVTKLRLENSHPTNYDFVSASYDTYPERRKLASEFSEACDPRVPLQR